MKLLIQGSLLLVGLAPPAFAQRAPRDLTPELLAEFDWRLIGPSVPAGRAWKVIGVDRSPKTLFVTTAGGGLWKTVNNGTTFRPVFDHYGSGSTGAVAVAPSNPDVVWLGTGESANTRANSLGDGVYRSTDGGETWTHKGLRDTHLIAEIVVHPTDPDVAYVAAMGHLWGRNEQRGLFRTRDGGERWTRVLYVDDTTGCSDVAMDPHDPDVLYAGLWQRFRYGGGDMAESGPGSGVFKSTDGGDTWARLGGGLPMDYMAKIEVEVSRQNSKVVYANILTGERGRGGRTSRQGGLYRSDDAGTTWRRRNPKQTSYYYDHLYLDPTNHDNVWMPVFELNRSTDGGRTFEKVNMRQVHNDLHSMWINPADTDHLVVAGDGGVSISFDGARTWMQTVLPIGQFYEVSVDNQDPYHVMAGMQDTGTWLGPSRTYDVEGITSHDWFKLRHVGDGMASATDPRDPNILYLQQQFGNTARLDLRTWERIELQPRDAEALKAKGATHRVRWNWTPAFALSRHDPDYLYVGSNYLFRIDGRTGDFEVISPDLTWQQDRTLRGVDDGYHSYGTLFSVAESPLDAELLWAGADDGPLWVTTDQGEHWIQVDANLPDGAPEHCVVAEIEASRFDRDTAYVVLDGHTRDDMRPHVYCTRDRGQSFTDITGDLPPLGPAYVVREDPDNPHVLYVGTEFGVFVSVDDGAHWVRLKNNLPTVPVRAMVIQARERELVAATFGRAVWIADIGPFHEMSAAMFAQPLHVFAVRPATKFRTRVTFGNTIEEMNGDQFFRAQNPPYGTMVTYYLRDDVAAVSIAVRNGAGEVVRALEGPASAGIHRVNWDLMPDNPRRNVGRATPEEAEFRRRVAPGSYSVQVSAGPHQQSRPILVKPEPDGVRQAPPRK